MPAPPSRTQMYCIIQHKNSTVKKRVEEVAHYEMQRRIAAIEDQLNYNTAEIEEMMFELKEFMRTEQSDAILDIIPDPVPYDVPKPEFGSEHERLDYYSARIDHINKQINEIKRLFKRAVRNRELLRQDPNAMAE
ncbi:hypothetical protein ACFE04_000502 [Oxalis oulophora]